MTTRIKTTLLSLMMIGMWSVDVNGKAGDGTIMTVDGEEVPTYEFLYLFNKNNLQQPEPQTLDEYLQLFEVYRLKVAEAKSQGADTTSSFKAEMAQYRRELLEPYITDTEYFNRLIDEATYRDSLLVESSHIMIIRTNDESKDKRNLQMLDSLRNELLNGADFIDLAKRYSEDKFSSDKGGYLGFSPAGTYPYGFETAVYETPEGEISEIVESHVGWHLVKPGSRKHSSEFNRPLKSREALKADVERRSSSPFDSRYHEIKKKTKNLLSSRHPEIKEEGKSDDEYLNELIEAEEISQYANNPEYRNLVDEYVNGSLLYLVSVENIWDKASNDTEGLHNYYNAHKDEYKWEKPHAKGILVQALNDSVAGVVKASVAGMPMDSISPYIRKNFKKEATADRFNVTEGTNAMIDNLMFGGPEATPKVKNFNNYFIIGGRIVETPEEFEDVRTVVINDYQEVLEQDWVENLRKKHQVLVNKKELSKIKKKLEGKN